MGNNSYFRTDSIGARGYDFSLISRTAYVHETNTPNYTFNFGGYYSPSFGGYSQGGYSMPSFATGNYSSNPVSNSYANSNVGAQGAESSIGTIQAHLANVMTLAQLKNDKNLSQARKDEIDGILKEAKQIEKNARENANYLIILEGIVEMAASLDTRAAELFTNCQEEIENALQNPEAKGADEGLGAGAGSTGSSTSSTSSVEVTEGDIELSDADLMSRYELKAPVVTELNSAYVANITIAADSRSSFMTALTTLDSKNIASFLVSLSNQDIADFCEKIDGQTTWADGDEMSMKEFLAKFDGALDLLKNSGFLSRDDYGYACRLVVSSKNQVKDSFTDDARTKIVGNLQALKRLLTATVNGQAVVKGSQEHFDALVKEKQAKETREAINKFYEGLAEASNGKFTFSDANNYKLDLEEIKYLPNKQVFQATIEGKTFEGKDFKELNKKIMKCKDESIINTWISLKEDMMGSDD